MENRFRIWAYFILIISVLHSAGCAPTNEFTTITEPLPKGPRNLHASLRKNTFIIAHEGDSAWHLSNVEIDWPTNTLKGKINELPPTRMTYKYVQPKVVNKTIPGYDGPFDEWHLSVFGINPDSTGNVVLYKENVYKVQTYQTSSAKAKSVIIGFIALAGLVAIWALSAQN